MIIVANDKVKGERSAPPLEGKDSRTGGSEGQDKEGERNISDRIQDREGDESGAGQGQGQGGDKSNDGGSCISPRLSSLDNRSAFSCYIGRLCFVLFHFMHEQTKTLSEIEI